MSFPRWITSILTVNILFFIHGLQSGWPASQLRHLMDSAENGVFLSNQELSLLFSFSRISATISPFLFGILTMIIGRKMTLLLLGFPVAMGQLVLAFSRHTVILYIGRFLTGIVTGGAFAVAPIYIAEISKKTYRGMLISSITVSINLGKVVGWILSDFSSYMVFNLLLAFVPVVFIGAFLMFGQESAYFYLSKHEINMAKRALEKLRGYSGDEIEREMDEIEGKTGETGGGQFKFQSKTKIIFKAILIVTGLLLFQTFSGFEFVHFYGYSVASSVFPSFPMHLFYFCTDILALIISIVSCPLVDVLGRRTCLLVSFLGTALSLAGIWVINLFKNTSGLSHTEDIPTIVDYSLTVPFILYVIFFNFGLHSIPFVVLAEILPANIKNITSSVLITLYFGAYIIVSSLFVLLIVRLRSDIIFAIYTVIAFAGLLFTFFFVKETKGKSLPEIQYALTNN